jgi:hypothetical protein
MNTSAEGEGGKEGWGRQSRGRGAELTVGDIAISKMDNAQTDPRLTDVLLHIAQDSSHLCADPRAGLESSQETIEESRERRIESLTGGSPGLCPRGGNTP